MSTADPQADRNYLAALPTGEATKTLVSDHFAGAACRANLPTCPRSPEETVRIVSERARRVQDFSSAFALEHLQLPDITSSDDRVEFVSEVCERADRPDVRRITCGCPLATTASTYEFVRNVP